MGMRIYSIFIALTLCLCVLRSAEAQKIERRGNFGYYHDVYLQRYPFVRCRVRDSSDDKYVGGILEFVPVKGRLANIGISSGSQFAVSTRYLSGETVTRSRTLSAADTEMLLLRLNDLKRLSDRWWYNGAQSIEAPSFHPVTDLTLQIVVVPDYPPIINFAIKEVRGYFTIPDLLELREHVEQGLRWMNPKSIYLPENAAKYKYLMPKE